MSAMAFQITSLPIVTQTFIQAQIKETPKLHVTGLCAGNSPVTGGEFPAQMASNAENVSIWWRHQEKVLAVTAWHEYFFLTPLTA